MYAHGAVRPISAVPAVLRSYISNPPHLQKLTFIVIPCVRRHFVSALSRSFQHEKLALSLLHVSSRVMTHSSPNVAIMQSPDGMETSALALRCCCGRHSCAYLEHNDAALRALERDLRRAAEAGQVGVSTQLHLPPHHSSMPLPPSWPFAQYS